MEAHCPQFAVRRVLAQTRRLFVLGFSTTGGGHERISSVLLEYLKGEELKGVTILVSMPEPWRGEMLADGSVPTQKRHKVDHTQSILAKLSPLVDKGSELIFVRALKTVVGFYTQRAAAAAKELMWEMVVARPEVYRGEEAKRLLCDRGFVLALKAPLSWEDLSPSLLPTARSLMDVLLAEITGEVVVLTDMDPNLTSAALKLKTERVTCLDYENHQDLLLHTFEVTSLTQLAAYASDFEALCKHYWNKMRPELFSERQIRTLRKLIKSTFLLKVLNMGRFHLSVAHVDIVDQQFRRLSRPDLELYAGDRRRSLRDLLRFGRRLTRPGEAHEGVVHVDGASEESIQHVVYVYAHLSGRAILNYFIEHIEENPKMLVVGCGKSWHKESLSDEELRGRRNVMRICQLAQGHGIVTAGAGACGELSDMLDTFPAPVAVVIPLARQHEQQHNGEMMRARFGRRLMLAVPENGFFLDNLKPFLKDFTTRVEAAEYLGAEAAEVAVQGLLRKPGSAEHAARRLAGTEAMTPKEELIHGFSELLRSSGMFLHLKVLRRHLKAFFQLTDQLNALKDLKDEAVAVEHRFVINECVHCTGKRVTSCDFQHAEVRVRELGPVFSHLGCQDLCLRTGEAWAQLLCALDLQPLPELAREEAVGGTTPMPQRARAHLPLVARSMMELAEVSSERFITGF